MKDHIIADISHEKLDKSLGYIIPDELEKDYGRNRCYHTIW